MWTERSKGDPWDKGSLGRILHNCFPLVSVEPSLVNDGFTFFSGGHPQRLPDGQLISVPQTLACPVSFSGILPLTPPLWDCKAVTQPTWSLKPGVMAGRCLGKYSSATPMLLPVTHSYFHCCETFCIQWCGSVCRTRVEAPVTFWMSF